MVDLPLIQLVLLDTVAAYRGDDADATMLPLALQRLEEIGAVTATEDEVGNVAVDASGLAHAAVVLAHTLVGILGQQLLISREEVLALLRETISGEVSG